MRKMTFKEALDIFEMQVKWYNGNIFRAYYSLSNEVKTILYNEHYDIYERRYKKMYELKCRMLTEKNAVGIKNYEKRKWMEWDLDHIVSISFGFQFGIPYELIASEENLRIIKHKENFRKGVKLTCDGIKLLRKWGYEIKPEYNNYGHKRYK